MEATLLYLLKAHVVLALFAAAYHGLLRRLTFFQLNRAYLLFALLFAAVYPALPVPGLLPAEAPAAPTVAWVLAEAPATGPAVALPPPAAPGPDWPLLALGLYASGVAVLLGRLLVQLLALARLRRATRPATTPGSVPYRQLPGPGDPFSFGRTIYLYPAQHTAAELAVVVAHEQAHVRQGHTLDVLLAHVGTALFWPSPAAWLLRRAVLDNLEYLADAATLRTGLDRRAYQYCLLQLSRGTVGPALALPFTFFTLKNRVAMMNTPLSSRGQLARYFLAGPLVLLAALGYSAAHSREAEPVAAELAGVPALVTSPVAAPVGPVADAPATTKQPAAKSKKAAPGLPPTVREYLATNYPQASITEITKGSLTPAGPVVYVVAVAQNQRKLNLAFDAAGRFLSEQKDKFAIYGPVGLFTPTTPLSTAKLASDHPATRQPAPAGAVQTGTTPLYYLDGQAVTEAKFKALDPVKIASIQVLHGEQARQMAGDKGRNGIVVVTTEANKNSAAVLAFNQRVQRYASLPAAAGKTPATFTPARKVEFMSPEEAAARKPAVTFALPADALYYLDGKPSTRQAVEQLDQNSIASVDVLKDPARIRRLPGRADSPVTSAILITTKANADAPAVRAFADQADLASAYTSRPVSVNVLRPAALAYITSHYPDARLNEVHELKHKTSGALKYQVQLINGKRPFYVYFTPEGEFAGE